MTDIGIYIKNADIQARAGVNANATEKLTAATDVYVLNIESMINMRTLKNWSTAFPGLDVSVKGSRIHVGGGWCALIVVISD